MLADRRRERRRQLPLTKKEAARRVMLQPLEGQQIRTDSGARFPRVLSFDEWQAVRRVEDEREQARLTLCHEKERHRLAFLVARGGQPLPQTDDKIKAALAAFTEACRQAQPAAAMAPPIASGPSAITNVAAAPLIEEAPVTDQRVAQESLARPNVAEIRHV